MGTIPDKQRRWEALVVVSIDHVHISWRRLTCEDQMYRGLKRLDQRVCVHLDDSSARIRKGTREELLVDMDPLAISVVPNKGKGIGAERIRMSKETHLHQRR